MTSHSASKSDTDSTPGNPSRNDVSGPSIQIIVAVIGCLGAICVACIAIIPLFLPAIQCWLQPYTCEVPNPTPTFTPALLSTPTISISSDVRDISGNPIDMNSAPFQVKVSGIVSNTAGYYVYLIVVDKNDHHVQSGLGQNIDNEFFGICQLGRIGHPDSYGQQYTIYAVVTDNPYVEFTSFKNKSYIAKSNELRITREPMPTSTP